MSGTATLEPRPTRVAPWSRLGDETLAGRAAGGSDAAFTTLYERYYGPLLGYTRSILRDAEDARDATQNALENAFRAPPGRDTSLPLRPWSARNSSEEHTSELQSHSDLVCRLPLEKNRYDGPW